MTRKIGTRFSYGALGRDVVSLASGASVQVPECKQPSGAAMAFLSCQDLCPSRLSSRTLIACGGQPGPLNVASRRYAAVANRGHERRKWAGKQALPVGAVSAQYGPCRPAICGML